MKKEALQQHIKSLSHQRAEAAKHAKLMVEQEETTPIEKSFQNADEKMLEKMDKFFRTAYFLAKQGKPFTEFEHVLELQLLNGVNLGPTYCNDKAAKDFTAEIAGQFKDDLIKCIESSHYFSLFCDGSTDRTETEKECIMIKVLENLSQDKVFEIGYATKHKGCWSSGSNKHNI